MIPTLKKGICGASLRTCSLIIAWIVEIFSTISLLAFIFAGKGLFREVVKGYKTGEADPESNEILENTLLWLTLGLFSLYVIIHLLLLIGIYTRICNLIMLYLIFTGVTIVLYIVSTIAAFVAMFINSAFIADFFSFLICGVFSTYFWLILNSYRIEIKTQALDN